MGTFVQHLACEACGSSDGNALYDDGSTYCHVCDAYGRADGEPVEKVGKPAASLLTGTYSDIPKRGLREATCQKFGYMAGEMNGQPCQIATYRDGGTPIAQKLRFAGKEFKCIGEPKKMLLYGQHLWGTKGKSVVITEGEIDCLSVAQAFDLKWPVVSLPNGAQSAVKAIQKSYEWLSGFDKIVLCFDGDEPGRKAAQEVAEILPVGKAFIMDLGDFKDANEALVAQGSRPIVDAFWKAAEWRPDGIVAGDTITRESLAEEPCVGYSLPYPQLTEMLMGLRKRELTLLTAGSGIGKSTLAREIAFHLHQEHGLTIGNVYLEESKNKTAQGYVAIDNNIPLGQLRANPKLLTDNQWDVSLSKVIHQRMYFYDHFGSMDSDRLLVKLAYMATVLGVDFIVLDHISIVVSGQSSSEGERKDIDILMTRLRTLIEETGVGIIAIVHLNKPEGKPHEEGGRVTLSNLRGSGSLKQLSDNIVALERDQQGENKNVSIARLLKNREHGELGLTDALLYDKMTGRLVLTAMPGEDAGSAFPTDDVPF